jgi:nucleotide-binding universal stress UspA family protein
MTKTLLVPLDGTDDSLRALPVAARLASSVDADVVLVTAALPGSPQVPSEAWLQKVAAEVGPRGARTEIVPSLEVSDALGALAAGELDPVVCMATHARARFGRAWFGSVAETVLRDLPYPIILVGPRCDLRWRLRGPIVAALDGSSAALEALGIAVDWDHTLGVGVSAVHVAHPLDTGLGPDAVLDAATKHYADAALRTCVLRSHEPEWEVVDHARRVNASFIVCATHGRIRVARVLMGSVAMGIVRRAACPVLVRPPAPTSRHEVVAPPVAADQVVCP